MRLRIRGISIAPDADKAETLLKAAAKTAGLRTQDISELKKVRRSIDARNKNDVRLIYTVDATVPQGVRVKKDGSVMEITDDGYVPPSCAAERKLRPIVAGFGPAGMFAALILAEAGLRPIVLERGSDVDTRLKKIDAFRKGGAFDPECNVQFGEGGAGTFSDGKLNTGTDNPRIGFVLKTFNRFGAPDEILWDAMPHVGTDILSDIVRNIRKHIISLGGEVRFDTRLTGIETAGGRVSAIKALCGDEKVTVPADGLVLATGHSARDTLSSLYGIGVPMEPKAFSMGVRIEHLRTDTDRAQYGRFAGHPALGAATYKLNCRTESGSAYTFCMCPGGYVIAAASEAGGVVTNGMSYSGRHGENSNSALLVTVTPDMFPYGGVFGGVEWQRTIERRAFEAGGGNYYAPAQLLGDFMKSVPSTGCGKVRPTYLPGVTWCDLDTVLPDKLAAVLREAIPVLDRRLHGFADPEAVLTAPETRSSSPVRVLRGSDCQSTLRGLYPCGEGAGYAGGIVSAAVDGIRCAEALING